MAHRSFVDSLGRKWDVWSVMPGDVERRRRAIPARKWTASERRHRSEERDLIDDRWAKGWLAFETRGEKRRLANYPDGWTELEAQALEWLCDGALVVPRHNRLLR